MPRTRVPNPYSMIVDRSALMVWLACLMAAQLGMIGAASAELTPTGVATRPDPQVEQAVRQFLTEHALREGLVNPVFDVSIIKSNQDFPKCRKSLTVEALDTRYLSHMRFAVTCEDAGRSRQEFFARTKLSAEVVVAATSISANKLISDAELALERRDITALPDALSDTKAVAGLSNRRPLRVGEIVNKQLLVAPELVQRGDTVTILANNGSIEVSIAGEALNAGRREDIVRVRNSATGKIIRARVTANATVEPVAMPIQPQFPE